ncbi:TetR family transcriptional regulator [Jatrophihabitans telluris]|uniref:TetR family transcriptional regulator n=1 Tax=Jatrophihabitans telluris TaxID=2038343 RepID=A0ABY4QUE9_9ACTN|nr:TetR family transcriptional regulator [Jatrophihabitans telluris]UQX86752.1 TetR family transcriptional regulator [Jatrophihabitans telluris]
MAAARSHRHDPLVEILLTPTTGLPVRPDPVDEAPVPLGSPPARMSSPMARTRGAILAGAGRAVSVSGTQISMTQIAAAAGVAKATLYNHFRTRDDVLAALLLVEVDQLIRQVGHLELTDALLQAALAISEHPMLEALGGEDTALLAVFARVDVRSPGWRQAAEAVAAVLNRAGRRGAPTVLRWLASFITGPADLEDIRSDVSILVAGLPPVTA